jgi:hypothetical protein
LGVDGLWVDGRAVGVVECEWLLSVANINVGSFAGFAATPGVAVVTGDFNGDGKSDLAAYGGAGWASLPVAFSNGDGTFNVTNIGSASFASWAATPGVDIVRAISMLTDAPTLQRSAVPGGPAFRSRSRMATGRSPSRTSGPVRLPAGRRRRE